MSIIFTEDIIKNPRKFLEHLNLLVREASGASDGGIIATTGGNIVGGSERMVPGAGMRFERELGVLKISASGIAGGVSGFTKSVAAAGIETATFANVGTSSYVPFGFLLNASGYLSTVIPQIPPLADSRTPTTCDFEVMEAGTLYGWIVPI